MFSDTDEIKSWLRIHPSFDIKETASIYCIISASEKNVLLLEVADVVQYFFHPDNEKSTSFNNPFLAISEGLFWRIIDDNVCCSFNNLHDLFRGEIKP